MLRHRHDRAGPACGLWQVAGNRCRHQRPTPRSPACRKAIRSKGLRVATRVGCNGCHEKDGRGGVFMDNPRVGRVVGAQPDRAKRACTTMPGSPRCCARARPTTATCRWACRSTMFQHLSDREVRDITAWLRSLPDRRQPGLAGHRGYSDAIAKASPTAPAAYDDDVPDPGQRRRREPAGRTPGAGQVPGDDHLHRNATAATSTAGGRRTRRRRWSSPRPIPRRTFARLMKTGEIATGRQVEDRDDERGRARGRFSTHDRRRSRPHSSSISIRAEGPHARIDHPVPQRRTQRQHEHRRIPAGQLRRVLMVAQDRVAAFREARGGPNAAAAGTASGSTARNPSSRNAGAWCARSGRRQSRRRSRP